MEHDARLEIRLSTELKARLQHAADEERYDAAQIVRAGIDFMLKNRQLLGIWVAELEALGDDDDNAEQE